MGPNDEDDATLFFTTVIVMLDAHRDAVRASGKALTDAALRPGAPEGCATAQPPASVPTARDAGR